MSTTTKAVLWWCRSGHTIVVADHLEVTAAWCPRDGHKGTNEMKPRALFPSWGPPTPPEGEGRRCCSTYPDEGHDAHCRYGRSQEVASSTEVSRDGHSTPLDSATALAPTESVVPGASHPRDERSEVLS